MTIFRTGCGGGYNGYGNGYGNRLHLHCRLIEASTYNLLFFVLPLLYIQHQEQRIDTKQDALDKAVAFHSALDNARGYCKNGIRSK
jgi:hypothetical protein